MERIMNEEKMKRILDKLYKLMDVATDNGGFWVSAGCGTLNVMGGVLSQYYSLDWAETTENIEKYYSQEHGYNWYGDVYDSQPNVEQWNEYRFDIKTIVRTAIESEEEWRKYT
jgi:hypothetical protein